jgi:hypothetical protein
LGFLFSCLARQQMQAIAQLERVCIKSLKVWALPHSRTGDRSESYGQKTDGGRLPLRTRVLAAADSKPRKRRRAHADAGTK